MDLNSETVIVHTLPSVFRYASKAVFARGDVIPLVALPTYRMHVTEIFDMPVAD